MRDAEFHSPQIRLARRYRFSAAHRLHSDLLPAGRNREVYGKCNNPFGHGHDYTLEVALRGTVAPRTGRLVPLDALDGFVRQVLLDQLDRRNLNAELAEFASLVPTTENLARVAARRLAGAWPRWFGGAPARIEKIRIWETRRNIFEVTVEEASSQGQDQHETVQSHNPGD